MTIALGDRMPQAGLFEPGEGGPNKVSSDDLFKGRKVVLVGMPGAFTPTCHQRHLPGFIENRDAILARDVEQIAVLSVNDHHVMAAWAHFTGGEGKIVFLADGNGNFVKALGLDADLSAGGLGTRSKRFSMIVDDGKVTALNIEDSPGKAVESGAARILELL